MHKADNRPLHEIEQEIAKLYADFYNKPHLTIHDVESQSIGRIYQCNLEKLYQNLRLGKNEGFIDYKSFKNAMLQPEESLDDVIALVDVLYSIVRNNSVNGKKYIEKSPPVAVKDIVYHFVIARDLTLLKDLLPLHYHKMIIIIRHSFGISESIFHKFSLSKSASYQALILHVLAENDLDEDKISVRGIAKRFGITESSVGNHKAPAIQRMQDMVYERLPMPFPAESLLLGAEEIKQHVECIKAKALLSK